VRPRDARIVESIAAVVVLPFVPETTAIPSVSRPTRRLTNPGSSRWITNPGTLVPAPRRATRLSERALRASAPTASAYASAGDGTDRRYPGRWFRVRRECQDPVCFWCRITGYRSFRTYGSFRSSALAIAPGRAYAEMRRQRGGAMAGADKDPVLT